MKQNYRQKIVSQKSFVVKRKKTKELGKSVVAVSGSFDVLHYGHLSLLTQAREAGDMLVVLLNSDTSVRTYKGPGRPIQPQSVRAHMLAALSCVDFVVLFDEVTPVSILEKLAPDIFFQGNDWGECCIERPVVEDRGGRICVAKKIPDFSTSDIIRKITGESRIANSRAVFLDQDDTILIGRGGKNVAVRSTRFMPRALFALHLLAKMNYVIVIVTNQAGIARGYFTEAELKMLHQWLVESVKKKDGRIDRIYFCPHDDVRQCLCRKPKPGMLLGAAVDFDLNLSKSWLVGDDERDVIAGRMANVRTIKIGKRMRRESRIKPHFYVRDLLDAVRLIRSQDAKIS